MQQREWSRSRFWLCHFLHNRHERLRIDWQASVQTPASLHAALEPWLARSAARPVVHTAHLIHRAAQRYSQDPAYVQSLRLMAKEQQYHSQLIERLRQRLEMAARPADDWWEVPWATALSLPGVRFELSVLLLADLIDLRLWRLLHAAAPTAALRDVSDAILRDKAAHAAFLAERLTMELADLNFIRRNLRRLRLRAMFAVALAASVASHGRLLSSAGATRASFVALCWSDFRTVLEQVVPYHREALLAALLTQRERPYDKPTLRGN